MAEKEAKNRRKKPRETKEENLEVCSKMAYMCTFQRCVSWTNILKTSRGNKMQINFFFISLLSPAAMLTLKMIYVSSWKRSLF